MGLGITPSRIFSRSTRSSSSSIEANEKMLKMQVEIDYLKDKASKVYILKAQVAFLMQMQMQNSRYKEVNFTKLLILNESF
jgi:predicted ATP-grasp superfamily ATP-dependent carboligase